MARVVTTPVGQADRHSVAQVQSRLELGFGRIPCAIKSLGRNPIIAHLHQSKSFTTEAPERRQPVRQCQCDKGGTEGGDRQNIAPSGVGKNVCSPACPFSCAAQDETIANTGEGPGTSCTPGLLEQL